MCQATKTIKEVFSDEVLYSGVLKVGAGKVEFRGTFLINDLFTFRIPIHSERGYI